MQSNQFNQVKCNPINLRLTQSTKTQLDFRKIRLDWVWFKYFMLEVELG